MPATLTRLGMGWGPQVAYDTKKPIRKLGDGFDSGDRDLYTTTTFTLSTPDNGTYQITAGLVYYVFYQATLLGGPADPTVTCSNGQTLEKIDGASDPDPSVLSLDKRKWVYGFIANTTGPVSLQFDHRTTASGDQTMTEARWYFMEAIDLYTAEGIQKTVVTGSAYGTPSNPNSTALSLPVQAVINSGNTVIGFLWAGNGQLDTTGTGDTIQLGDSVKHASATTTLAVYYYTGNIPSGAFGMSWGASSFSNGAHTMELRGINSIDTRIVATALGPGLSVTTSASSFTYPSVAPAARALLLLAVCNSRASAVADPTSITGLGLTWTLVGSIVGFNTIATPTEKISLWRATTGAVAPTPGTIVVDYGGVNQTGQILGLCQFLSVDGTAPTLQPTTASSDGSTNPGVTLANFSDSLNGVFAVVGSNPGSVGWDTPGQGYIELMELRHATPNTGMALIWRRTPDTHPNTTIASAPWGVIAVEVVESLITYLDVTTPGAVTLTGQGLGVASALPLAGGALTLTGQGLGVASALPLASGALALTGQGLGLAANVPLTAGAIGFTSQGLGLGTSMPLTAGAIGFAGQSLAAAGGVPLTAGAIGFAGQTITVAASVIPLPQGDFSTGARSSE